MSAMTHDAPSQRAETRSPTAASMAQKGPRKRVMPERPILLYRERSYHRAFLTKRARSHSRSWFTYPSRAKSTFRRRLP